MNLDRWRRWLVPGLALGAVLRVLALPLAGTSDVIVWKTWAFGASTHLTHVYGVGGVPPERRELVWQTRRMTVDYPPVAVVELAAMGRVYRHIDPDFEDSRALNVLVKLPGVLWELVLVGVLLTWGRRRLGDGVAAALALVWWLNPAVIVDGAVLGYLDMQMAVPAVLALVAAASSVPWLAAALLLLAIFTKAQAIFVAPAVVWLALRRAPRTLHTWTTTVGSALAVVGLVIGPYIARGAGPNLYQAVGRLATHDMLSANAANAWWLVTWVLRVRDMIGEWGFWRSLTQDTRILAISSAMDLGYPNARIVGALIVSVAVVWAWWRVRAMQTLSVGAAFGAWCVHTYAVWAAQVHENHLALALPFAALALVNDARARRVYVGVSLVVLLNVVLFYGAGLDLPVVLPRRVTLIDATVWLAAANLALWLWHTRAFAAVSRADVPVSMRQSDRG